MSRRTLQVLAGVVGSAIVSWWWVRQWTARHTAENTPWDADRGTVIYSNTPVPMEDVG